MLTSIFYRWKIYQPHDVVAECAKISLDPVDAIKEATYIVDMKQNDESIQHRSREFASQYNLNQSSLQSEISQQITSKRDEKILTRHMTLQGHQSILQKLQVSQTQDLQQNVALLDRSKSTSQISLCNPSEICGLSTPASSRPMSPSNSGHEHLSLMNSFKPLNFENESVNSTQNLNENHPERKSSGETMSSRDSPISKTKSAENVQKAKLKMWMSNTTTHSTPLDHNTCAQGSPHRSSSTKSYQKRPCSTEVSKVKKDLSKTLSLGISDQLSVQSAPVSPMVQGNQQFMFNSNNVISPLLEKKLKEESNIIPDSKKHLLLDVADKDTSQTIISVSDVPSSMPLFSAIKDMFMELTIRPTRNDSDAAEIPCRHTCRVRSPLSLLDDFIQYGADVHFYELNR